MKVPAEIFRAYDIRGIAGKSLSADVVREVGRALAVLGRERGARKKIHEEIGVLQSSVARVETETTKQSEDLAEVKQDVKDMNARVDLVPERTINLLKTTGVIK